jgi:hypothetical protein
MTAMLAVITVSTADVFLQLAMVSVMARAAVTMPAYSISHNG